jgi:hypothetical protein
MKRDAAMLSIFPDDGKPAFPKSDEAAQPQPGTWYVHYVDRMTQEEIAAAVDQLFEGDAPLDALLLFEHRWSTANRQHILEMLESRGPKSPHAWLVLADLRHAAKQNEAAREALLYAQVLCRTVPDPGNVENRIRELAKKWKLGKLEESIDAESLTKLGLVELAPSVEIPEMEIGSDERASYFALSAEGQIKIVSIGVIEDHLADGKRQYQLSHVETFGSGRSWGTGGPVGQERPNHVTIGLDGPARATFTVQQLPGKPRFSVNAKLEADSVCRPPVSAHRGQY